MENKRQNNGKEDGNSLTEEEIKELNLYAEERRQESIAKYGRDIYAENRTIGNKKIQKANGIIDKILSIFFKSFHYVIIILLIFILIRVWIPLIRHYS